MARIFTIYRNCKELKIDLDSDVDLFEHLSNENRKHHTDVSTIELLEALEKFGLAKRVI